MHSSIPYSEGIAKASLGGAKYCSPKSKSLTKGLGRKLFLLHQAFLPSHSPPLQRVLPAGCWSPKAATFHSSAAKTLLPRQYYHSDQQSQLETYKPDLEQSGQVQKAQASYRNYVPKLCENYHGKPSMF